MEANGNLKRDAQAGITNIEWNIYGKIKQITRSSTGVYYNMPHLTFEYAPDGQRVSKIVKPQNPDYKWEYTFYVRDAQGNVMATYSRQTNKKINFENITFGTLNDSIVAAHGTTAWKNFMTQTAEINTPDFKSDYIDYILNQSLGTLFLDAWTLGQVLTDHPELILSAWSQYTAMDRMTAMRNYIGRQNFTNDLINTICSLTLQQIIADPNYLSAFETNLQNDAPGLYADWLNWKLNPVGTAEDWLCSHVSGNILQGCIYNLGQTVFENITNQLALSGAAVIWLDGQYSATQKHNAMDQYGHSTWLTHIYNQYLPHQWKLYWTSTQPPDYYQLLLTHFPLQSSYVQDINSYYPKSTFMYYLRTYFGQAYYDTLMARLFKASKHYEENFSVEELYIYGSSRIGTVNAHYNLRKISFDADYYYGNNQYSTKYNVVDSIYKPHYNYTTQTRGNKLYELTNHLGNVLTVITDQWRTQCIEEINETDTLYTFLHYKATVLQATDYAAFGASLPGRSFNAGDYRYSYQSQEMDNKISGVGNSYSFTFRDYDPRIGRMKSPDPLAKKYPSNSPYAFSHNRVIDGVDMEGLQYVHYVVLLDKNGSFIKKAVAQDFRNMTAAQVEKTHGINATIFYQTYSQSFGPEGRGVKYTYYQQNENGSFTQLGDPQWEVKQSIWTVIRHGFYYGSGAVTKAGPLFGAGVGKYDFSLKPIDMTDAIAREHDIAEDRPGFTSWTDPSNIFADIKFVKQLEHFQSQVNSGELVNDPFTGRQVSNEAYKSASNAIKLFSVEIANKKASVWLDFQAGNMSEADYNAWLEKVKATESAPVSLPTNQ